jgi:hypothetical protein
MFRSVPLLVLANFCYLERIDLPTLIVHGDDDQLVPIDASARRSAEPVKDTTLKVYPGGAARAGPGCPAIVLAILQERGFLPEMRRLLAGAPDRPAEVVLPELAAGFHRLLADHLTTRVAAGDSAPTTPGQQPCYCSRPWRSTRSPASALTPRPWSTCCCTA